VKANRSVYRCSLTDLIEALTKAEREGPLAERIRFYVRASLPSVDEISYLPITSSAANLRAQLVNARYEKGAVILTPNRGLLNGVTSLATGWLQLLCWTAFCTTPV
jgi:DNA replication protein DnaC